MFRILILLAGLASVPCSAEFRDPTQPAYPLPSTADAAGNNNALVLSAIWISSHSRRATINGVSAKQGQTIVIGSTPADSATLGDKKNEQLAPATGSGNTSQLPGQSALTAETSARQPTNTVHHAEIIPARSSTVKIISIRKNSVTVSQNGELKTLQLVQRPYKK